MSLGEAAALLDVHYQTAYRWVRSGELQASKLRGSYVLDADDVAAFAARRDRPTSPPTRRPRHGFEELADRLLTHLLTGDDVAARRLFDGLIANGVTVTEAAQEVLAPAMRRIGERWHQGEVSIPIEHRATAIAERILGEHAPNPRGRRRGRVAVAAVAGDRHGLATTMAATALREDNWHVEHLGADVPPDEIEGFGTTHGVDLYVLTVATDDAHTTAGALARRLTERGVPTLIGTPGSTLAELQHEAREAVQAARRGVRNKLH